MATVICRTPDCINEGVPIEVPRPLKIDPDTGEELEGQPIDDPWQIACGPCGQDITDITDVNGWVWNPRSADGR